MNIWHDIDEDRIFPTDFTIYKSLEGKNTVVNEFGGPIEAVAIIEKCMENYRRKFVEGDESL